MTDLSAICNEPHPADEALRCGRRPHPDQPDAHWTGWTVTDTPILWFDEEKEDDEGS